MNRFIAELVAIHDGMEIVEQDHSYGLAQCERCSQNADYCIMAGEANYRFHRGFTFGCDEHTDEIVYEFVVSILRRKIDASEMEVDYQGRLRI